MTLRCIGFALIGILSQTNLYAQQVNVQPDSLKKILCKKWEINYVLMGAARIGRMPGASNLIYEFKPDNTFIFIQGEPKDNVKGKWDFDPEKKLIRLLAKGKSNTTIISLIPEELIISADMKNTTPSDAEDMKMVFKIKSE